MLRHHAISLGQQGDPQKHAHPERDHDHQRSGGVLGFGRLEDRDTIGERLHSGERGAAIGEGTQDEKGRERDGGGRQGGVAGRRRTTAESEPPDADGNQGQDAGHEKISGHGEDPPGLADSAQIAESEQQDEPQRQGYAVRLPDGKSGGNRRDARRHTHRHGENVIGQQGRRGHQRDSGSDVVLGYAIGTTSIRIGIDRLAIGKADDQHQDGDHHTEGRRQPEGRRTGYDQGAKYFLGGVGNRGQRVRRQDGEAGGLGEPFVVREMRGDGLSHEHLFEETQR